MPSLQPPINYLTIVSQFDTIDQRTVEETVRHLKSSTCCLDTLPSDFFLTIINSVKTDLHQIVNGSLLSDTLIRF